VQSQVKFPSKNFIIHADYSRFWQNDSTAYVEIATAVYPSLVTLKQDSLGYHGKIELNIIIQNKSTGLSFFKDRFNIPINLTDSSSLTNKNSLISNTTYVLGLGSYTVTVNGHDVYDSTRTHSMFFPVDIMKKPGIMILSDIELCSNISGSLDQKDQFYKNTYRVIPHPSNVFGSTTSPVVFTYAEFYNLNTEMKYEIKVQIVDYQGVVKKRRIHQRQYTDPNVVDVSTLNVTSLSSGKYDCEIIISDTLGHELAKTQHPIFLYNPHLQQSNITTPTSRSAEFAGMSSEELANEFQTAQYIVSSEDNRMFDKLTTREARQNFLENFWTKIENEKQGHSDLTRAVYLKRVSIANQRYIVSGKEGWRSDRGRVFILYGEPDETQRFASSSDKKPYEIWNYHRIEGGVEFIFIDCTGFCEYILVHSSMHNEIHDESWEQLLR
jgi:GWxTD domain-containing protein